MARLRVYDWRIWVGLAITAVAIAWTARGITLSEVTQSLATATLWPLLLVPLVQIVGLWLRSLRWGLLVRSLSDAPIGLGLLFRATSVGFMVMNLLPFRIGELARPWLLSRESEVRGPAALGTVVLERAIDFTALAVIGSFVIFSHRDSLPGWVRTGALIFALLSCIPLGLAVLLRRDEGALSRLTDAILRLGPEAIAVPVRDFVAQMSLGLNSLKSGRDGLLVLFYTFLIWGLVFPIPYALGLLAFGIEFPPSEFLRAPFTTHVLAALAVAAPSAPGFFGVFHFACRESLALFGIPPAIAVAYGTVLHLGYWIPVTLVGLVCSFLSGTRVLELADADLGKGPSGPHR